jgi:hypothetical protein
LYSSEPLPDYIYCVWQFSLNFCCSAAGHDTWLLNNNSIHSHPCRWWWRLASEGVT